MLQQMDIKTVELTREDYEVYEDLVDDVRGGEVVFHLPKSFKGFMEVSTMVYCSFVTETQKVKIAEKEKGRRVLFHLKENISKGTEIRRNRGCFC